jgi:hypothetical protein
MNNRFITNNSYKTFNIIVRGFLYKKNWRPLSTRKRKGIYTIDFRNNYEPYKQLFLKLKYKYNTKIYFSTYDTTPNNIINHVIKEFDPENIFLSSEINSSQFTTAVKAIKTIEDHSDLTLLIRSDLYLFDSFIDFICDYDYAICDNDPALRKPLYLLSKEKNNKKSVDIFHIIPNSIIQTNFLDYIKRKKLRDTHLIHRKIHSCFMSPIERHNHLGNRLYKLPNTR